MSTLIFPSSCAGCNVGIKLKRVLLCPSCLYQLPVTDHFSLRSDIPVAFSDTSINLAGFGSLLYFRKGGITQKILHEIKYKQNKDLAESMGRMLGLAFVRSTFAKGKIVLVPVPLHSKKLKIRGYNQSELIARGFASVGSYPLQIKILVRKEYRLSQTQKGRLERFDNLQNTFESVPFPKINGQHIVLVDDVFTTGATSEACIMALKKSFPDSIFSVVTLAIASNG